MSFLTMEPSNQTFKALMSNGVKYNVPRFQRDYSWGLAQWEDLWEDIESLDEEEHYMGYIVLQRDEKDKNTFSIIDGQQRLITLSLLVLAAMHKIQKLVNDNQDAQNNTLRLKGFRSDFIGSLSRTTLTPYNKLTLNRNNNEKFRFISKNLNPLIKRNITKTNRSMSDCFEFFCKKITQNSGIDLVNFIEEITDSMLFTKIIVDDNLNAYKVFETLNARGVQLSTPDLLKNYLFSQVADNDIIDDTELDDMDIEWGNIISELGERNFTDFVRYYHNAHYPLVTKKKLFANIRTQIQQTQAAQNYLTNLSKYAPIYAALNNPADEFWHQPDYAEIKRYLNAFKLFNIKQPFVLLLTAYDKFSAVEFIKLAKYLYIFSIRYNVIAHHSPNELEKMYNALAIKISTGELTRASHIKNQAAFKHLYPNDKAFVAIFKYHTMPSRQSSKKIRFLLAQIENNLAHTNLNTSDLTLEHITPYNITAEWVDYYDGNYQQDTDKLGNMVLLTPQENSDCGTQLFDKKRAIYQNSHCKLAQKIAEYEQWDSATLECHQNWLAAQAVNTWTIHYE